MASNASSLAGTTAIRERRFHSPQALSGRESSCIEASVWRPYQGREKRAPRRPAGKEEFAAAAAERTTPGRSAAKSQVLLPSAARRCGCGYKRRKADASESAQ